MRSPTELTPSDLAFELQAVLPGHAWYLLTTDAQERTVEDLTDALEGAEIAHVIIDAPTVGSLAKPGAHVEVGILMIAGDWTDEDLMKLDSLRELLRATWPALVFVAGLSDAKRLTRNAPNLASFVTATTATAVSDGLDAVERDAHLSSLRERLGLTDEQVVALAEHGELPQDADHQVWLILLGRGDLVPTRGGAL